MYEKLLENCTLCPRVCKVNRLEGMRGYCGMDSRIRAARAALHMWEARYSRDSVISAYRM